MSAEDDVGPLRDLIDLFDEDGALLLELGHHVDVVHDLLAHVDRGAVALEGLLHRHHGTVHTRAVSARCGEQNPLASGHRVILKPPGRRTNSWKAGHGEMNGSRSHP